MTPVAPSQLTFNFEPALPDRFASLRAYVAHRAAVTRKPMKSQAADMDIAPSTLSRKLNPAEGDTQRFNLDDLEAWIASTGEAEAVIEYLAAKYMDSPDARRQRVVSRVEAMLTELAAALPALKEQGT
jgi:hypothetical protein